MNRYLLKCVSFAILILCLISVAAAPSLMAQSSSTGAIAGTVKDPSGAVVPNVAVTATSAATGTTRTATSGADGTYTLGLLPPGDYSVKFEASGFETTTVPSVTVTVTETGTLDQALHVGAQTQEVTVQANVETVETTNATVGATIAGRTVTDLPLATRNYTNLLSLSAGANAPVSNAAALGKDTQPTAANGSSQQQNNYQMDGASIVSYTGVGGVTEGGSRGAFGIPNPDTIQEFKIQTSQYDAGYGRNPGANVNVVTKSGTNDFHGDAFEYFRNAVLNAGDWFAKENGITSNANRLLDQNQYGGTLGGPIKKDKLFFFVSYQGTAQKNGESGVGLINTFIPALPTGSRGTCPAGATAVSQCDAAAQAFVSALGTMYAGKTGQNFPGGLPVSGTDINPTTLQILQLKIPNGSYYLPSPVANGVASPGVSCGSALSGSALANFPSSSWAAVYPCTATSPAIYHEYQGMGNADYVINGKNTLSERYFYSTDPAIEPFYQAGVNVPGTPENARFTNHEGTMKLTTVVSSNVVNEARFSYQRNLTDSSTSEPFLTASAVGMAALNGNIGYDVLPRIDVGSLNFGTSVFGTTTNHADQFQWADQISWTKGKHTIRAGFEADHNNWNWNFVKGLGAGLLIVSSPADFLLGRPGCAPGTFPVSCNAGVPGNTNGTILSNIIDEPNLATRYSSESGGDFHFWNYSYSSFFQDDIKLTQRLTVNVGVRWEYDGYPSERDGKGGNINTNLAAVGGVPLTSAPCPASPANPAPVTPCSGSSLVGFTLPSNYNTAILGPIPTGVFVRNGTTLSESKTPLDDFAPRIGFAYQPLASNKWVVRGGGGFFYDFLGGEDYIHGVLQGEPYAETLGGGGPSIFFASLQQPYASTPANWTPRYVTASGLSSGISQPILPPNFPVPLTYEWNLNTQYEFLPGWVLEIGYVGSRGIHQDTGSFAANPALLQNAAVTGAAPSTANTNLRVPLLGFSPQLTASFANNADTKYNGLQLTARKNLSHGLTFQAAYSYNRAFLSNWEGNAAITGATANPTWNLNPIVSQYGLNGSYAPQRFTLNYSYDLPVHVQGALGYITNGWRVSGETTIQQGFPLNVVDNNLGSIFGFSGGSPIASEAEYLAGAGRADAGTTGSIESRVKNGWINVNAFCSSHLTGNPCQNAYTISNGTGFGDAGQGNLLGPPQNNWDISLSKLTRVGGLHESANLEFRAEFFDAFNHPQFSNPGNSAAGSNPEDISTGGSPQITSLSVNPRLIQFALKYIF